MIIDSFIIEGFSNIEHIRLDVGDGGNGIAMLGGMTLSEYIYRMKETDADSFRILSDGIKQLISGVVSFEPDEITLSDGRSKVYDIRIQEEFNSQPTS